MFKVEPSNNTTTWKGHLGTVIIVCCVLIGFTAPLILYNFGSPMEDWTWEFPVAIAGGIVYFLVVNILWGFIEILTGKDSRRRRL